jgi:O-phospho-L-seryl-tRNASec:L-selenocysteinyl-tRNA synthase
MATGVTLGLILSAVRNQTGKNEMVYARVNHNNPIKAIQLAGLKQVTADGKVVDDKVVVPVDGIEKAITKQTYVILTTTTFFAPREPDKIKEIAKIAKENNVYQIINNAYGVQSREIMKRINAAMMLDGLMQ